MTAGMLWTDIVQHVAFQSSTQRGASRKHLLSRGAEGAERKKPRSARRKYRGHGRLRSVPHIKETKLQLSNVLSTYVFAVLPPRGL